MNTINSFVRSEIYLPNPAIKKDEKTDLSLQFTIEKIKNLSISKPTKYYSFQEVDTRFFNNLTQLRYNSLLFNNDYQEKLINLNFNKDFKIKAIKL